MFNWFVISETKKHEQIVQNRKKKLIAERRENCKDKKHSTAIIAKREVCNVLGCHVLAERKIGRGYEFIYEKQCTRCDYVEWISLNYHDYEGYIHTRGLKK